MLSVFSPRVSSGTIDVLDFATILAGAILDGTCTLLNRASGKALDNLGSTVSGATVVQWSDNTSNNQKWTIEDMGTGYYKFKNLTNGDTSITSDRRPMARR